MIAFEVVVLEACRYARWDVFECQYAAYAMATVLLSQGRDAKVRPVEVLERTEPEHDHEAVHEDQDGDAPDTRVRTPGPRPRKITRALLADARELIATGRSMRDAAALLHVPRTTLAARLDAPSRATP